MLRFSARFTSYDVPGRGVLCVAEEEPAQWLDSPVYRELVQELAGPRSEQTIIASLSARYAVPEIEAALEDLKSRGLAVPELQLSRPRHAYWEKQSETRAVSLTSLTHEGVQTIRQALESHNFVVRDDAPMHIVITDDYLRPEVADIAAQQKTWLLAKPVGQTIWVGPLFAPGNGACWRCLAAALKGNRWRQATLFGWSERDFPPEPSVAATPATLALAAGLIALAAASWISERGSCLIENAVLSFDTRTLKHSMNLIRESPDCAACGKHRNSRERSLCDLISPITGIVSKVVLIPTATGPLFHARAEYIHPLPVPGTRPLLEPMFSLGTGIGPSEAQNACIGEAVERYSTTYRGDEPRIAARAAEVDCILPTELLLFSEGQYNGRQAWNSDHSELHFVPYRYDPNTKIEWVPAKSLVSSRLAYVPAAYCYFSYFEASDTIFCRADSNGCAAGATLQDAILAAVLELVERDAVAIWWYNRIRRPSVNLDALGLTLINSIREYFGRDHRNVYLLDLTSDLSIPAYVAVAPKHDGSEPLIASAAHVSPQLAALKALKELAQIHFWADCGYVSDEMSSWLSRATLRNNPYLDPVTVPERADYTTPPEREYLHYCLERLCSSGLDPLYVDMTRIEIGVPVVRVIIPGFRHFWARLGPGRLYDIPVQMRWLQTPRSEQEMNPIGCML